MLWKFLLSLLPFFNPHRRHHDVPVGPISDSDILEAHKALYGDHYGGDMIFDDISDARINHTSKRWPGYPGSGVIPYVIDSSLADQKKLILRAMAQYNKLTCIKFVPRKNEKNYINLFKGNGCSSYVGMVNSGSQNVSLGQGCHYIGTIVHELGHAIGLYHEHQRYDRGLHVDIYKNNVTEGKFHNFDIIDAADELIYLRYDYDSIMHYGNYAFSKAPKRLMTMEATTGYRLLEPYEKRGVDLMDLYKVKRLYKCENR